MNFSLSPESRILIQQSSNLDCRHQCSTALYGSESKENTKRDYIVKEPRDVAPRGSIYLQMGRIFPLRKIKSYLKNI